MYRTVNKCEIYTSKHASDTFNLGNFLGDPLVLLASVEDRESGNLDPRSFLLMIERQPGVDLEELVQDSAIGLII